MLSDGTATPLICEHGDSSFPTWSSAMVGPVPLDRFPLWVLGDLGSVKAESAEFTRRRGLAVVGRKGHTSAAIAVAVSRIVESVLGDQRRIYTVSTRPLEDYGVGETAVLTIPCVLGRGGVVRRLPLALDRAEREMLTRSAAILEAAYRDHVPRGPHGHPWAARDALGHLHYRSRKTA
jgi:L-lactate dehydrogenase